MTKYKVTLEIEMMVNGVPAGLQEVEVEAESVESHTDWIVFSSGSDFSYKVVASFPTARVISVVEDSQLSS